MNGTAACGSTRSDDPTPRADAHTLVCTAHGSDCDLSVVTTFGAIFNGVPTQDTMQHFDEMSRAYRAALAVAEHMGFAITNLESNPIASMTQHGPVLTFDLDLFKVTVSGRHSRITIVPPNPAATVIIMTDRHGNIPPFGRTDLGWLLTLRNVNRHVWTRTAS